MNDDALREELARVKPAQRLQADKALVVDELHDEADLVHVGGDHQLLRLGGAAALEADQVAHRVAVDPVDQRPHFGADDLPQAVFLSGDAGGVAKLLEQVEVHAEVSFRS